MKVKCTTERWDFFTSGKEYDVIFKVGNKYYVKDDEGDETDLCDYECEVVEESNQQIEESAQQPTQEPTREFKVGDRVKIVKKHTIGDFADWVPEMDMTIGYMGIVNDINQRAIAVGLETGGYWWYPIESLELVEEAKQDKIKDYTIRWNEIFENYRPPLIIESPINNEISYQEFLDAFDYDDSPYIEINKEKVVIGIVDNRLECTTHEREQEVMKALIMLYGKREGERLRWKEKQSKNY